MAASTTTTRVGFVGLGNMGGAIADRIIEAGFHTTLWARNENSLEPYKTTSAVVAASLKELGESCNVVGVCVFNDQDVRQVVAGDGDGILYDMAPGSVIAIHSTITRETCADLEVLGKQRGVGILDAPVSGARSGAATGNLAIMVGGDEEAFKKAEPIFQSYGSTVCHMGGIGSGQAVKALNNVLCFANSRLATLALSVADRMGLKPESTLAILTSGSGRSFAMEMKASSGPINPDFVAHAIAMMEKDLVIFQDICRSTNIESTRLDQLAEENIRSVEELVAKNPAQ